MKIDLFYGKKKLTVDIPDANVSEVFRKGRTPGLPDPSAVVLESLRNPIQSPPLAELAKGRDSACIVVNDITRPVPNRIILPEIISELRAGGVPDSGIFFLNATGSHRPNTGSEIVELIGEELASEYRFENHDSFNIEEHMYVGMTKNGTGAYIDKRYLTSDLKVLTGLIEPHFMAGYSGGRKALCPGIAAINTIHKIHSPRFLEDENTANFSLLENPLHIELMEICGMAGVDFITNVLLNEDREITAVFSGHHDAAHMRGVNQAMRDDRAMAKEAVEIVVTSSAGYPLDRTYYQAIKGMVGALNIVKTGGTIIVVAECSEGLGNETFKKSLKKYAEIGDIKSYINHICVFENFIPDQWQVEMLLRALKKAQIILVADGLSEEDKKLTLATCAESIDEAINIALETHSRNARIAVIPEGPYVIPTLGD